MAQLEYGDYYKFVASAGIGLVVVAVVGPWLFLREPFDLAIEAAKLGALTPTARNIVVQRQQTVAVILHVIPYISGALGILGVILLLYGLIQWRERQRIRDQSEDLAVEKQERELHPLTPQEVEAEAREELELLEEEPQQTPPTARSSTATVNAYLGAERALFRKIEECFGPSVKLLTHTRVKGVEYDAVLRPREGERVIVEVKYIRKGFNQGWLAESVNELTAKTALYGSRFSTPARAVLIIILASSDETLPEKIEKLKDRLHAERSRSSDIRIHHISESAISELSCRQLREILGADPERALSG